MKVAFLFVLVVFSGYATIVVMGKVDLWRARRRKKAYEEILARARTVAKESHGLLNERASRRKVDLQ